MTGRQEPEDLGRGTKKLTLGNIVRAYALDWVLVVSMWSVEAGSADLGADLGAS